MNLGRYTISREIDIIQIIEMKSLLRGQKAGMNLIPYTFVRARKIKRERYKLKICSLKGLFLFRYAEKKVFFSR